MKIKIIVVPNAKKNEVVKDKELKVYVKAPAREGKANKEVIGLLAKYLKVKKSQVKIVKGEKSKEKIVEIL